MMFKIMMGIAALNPSYLLLRRAEMTRFLVFLLTLVVSPANATPNLIGQWKSDAALSMRFNTERAKMADKTALFLSQLMGHMTMTFDDRTIVLDMPDVETATYEGKKSKLTGFRETNSYRVLGVTQKTIAIQSTEPITGHNIITIYNFDSPDVMWVYSDGADSALPTSHIREYFIRVRSDGASHSDSPDAPRW